MVWPLVLRQKDACKSVCSWRQNSGWLHSQFIQCSFNGDIHIQGRHMKASFWHLLISFASVKDFWMLGLVLKLSWTLSLTWAAWSAFMASILLLFFRFWWSTESTGLPTCSRALSWLTLFIHVYPLESSQRSPVFLDFCTSLPLA